MTTSRARQIYEALATWPMIGKVVVWACALRAVLELHSHPLGGTHTICGPWGCGPPPEALLAYHGFWLLLLVPPLVLLADHLPAVALRNLGRAFWGLGILGLAAVGCWEAIHWLPTVGADQRLYFAHRYLFSVVCLVDFPIFQLLLSGCLLTWWVKRTQDSPQAE